MTDNFSLFDQAVTEYEKTDRNKIHETQIKCKHEHILTDNGLKYVKIVEKKLLARLISIKNGDIMEHLILNIIQIPIDVIYVNQMKEAFIKMLKVWDLAIKY